MRELIRRITSFAVLAVGLAACSGGGGSSTSGSTGSSSGGTTTSGSSAGGTTGSSTGGTTAGGGGTTVNMNLTFTGCTPDLATNLIVATAQDSIAIERSDKPITSGQLFISLATRSGTIALSTSEASNTGDRIVVYAPEGVFQNSSVDATDPIAGTVTVNHFDPTTGVEDLVFDHAVLEVGGGPTTCTVNGSVTTSTF